MKYRVKHSTVYEVGESTDGEDYGYMMPRTSGEALDLVADDARYCPLVTELYEEWEVREIPSS